MCKVSEVTAFQSMGNDHAQRVREEDTTGAWAPRRAFGNGLRKQNLGWERVFTEATAGV